MYGGSIQLISKIKKVGDLYSSKISGKLHPAGFKEVDHIPQYKTKWKHHQPVGFTVIKKKDVWLLGKERLKNLEFWIVLNGCVGKILHEGDDFR